jgi:RNA polymerase sigma factor (sigma-70 family)
MLQKDIDTNALLERCKKQETAAQKELVHRVAPQLLSVARRYARIRAEADDILQESFLSIFKNAKQYESDKGHALGWMRRIVVHTAIGHYRRHRFRYEYNAEVLPDTQDVLPDVWSQMGFEEICTLVQQLPDGAREVFNMAVFDDFSHDEIAAALHIPAGTSRSLLSRARKILQAQIKALYNHELAGF